MHIITEKSLLLSGQHIDKIFEENIFKFLLIGEDDSNIISFLSKAKINHKKGKNELYKEWIKKLKNKLENIDYTNIEKQIEKLDETIKKFRENRTQLSDQLKQYSEEKNNLYKKINAQKAELITIQEVLKRGNILKQQYVSDIARLKATIEFGASIDLLSTSSCPICDTKMISSNLINSTEYRDSANKEIKKIKLLVKELEESQKLFIEEKEELEEIIEKDTVAHENIIDSMEKELDNRLEEISNEMQIYINKKEELLNIKTIKETLEEHTKQQEIIQKLIDDNKTTGSIYETLTTSLVSSISKYIQDILENINFDNPKEPNVSFSEKLVDFVYGEENRNNYGKGYRAILYAVFIIALLEYFRTKEYQIGFVIIDSPLNPYKPDEQRNDEIPNNLGVNFYTYLAENIKDEQVILIENTPIPDDLKDKVNYKEFTKESGCLSKITTNIK